MHYNYSLILMKLVQQLYKEADLPDILQITGTPVELFLLTATREETRRYDSITITVIVIIPIVVVIVPVTVVVVPVSVVSKALALVGASIRALTIAALLSLVVLFQLCFTIVGLAGVATIIVFNLARRSYIACTS